VNPSDHRPFRVLVVEDDVPLARAIARQLRSRGYDVSVAHSASEATEQTREHAPKAVQARGVCPEVDGEINLGDIGHELEPFDAAIFDIELPDARGPELARDLLNQGRVMNAVFYSSSLDEALRAKARELGPLVDKLSDPSALFRLLEKIEAGERAALAAGAEDSTPNPSPNQSAPVSGRRVRPH
jgi:CheY-like chemotaxis protein